MSILSRRIAALVCAALLAVSVVAWAKPAKSAPKGRYSHDRVMVKFKDVAPGKDMAAEAAAANVPGDVIHIFKRSGVALIRLNPGLNVDAVIAQLQANPRVAEVRRDHYLHIHATYPNDPIFGDCWGLHNTGFEGIGTDDADIDAPEAWTLSTGSASVIVGVVDTGVDYTHEDLTANMWVNTAELNGSPGVDDDSNGFVDDVHGISVLGGVRSGDPMDDHGHGTHVSGILGAVGNNDLGIAGVNWNVRIMALKFLDASGGGYESDAAQCIEYAITMGAQVLNNSYGGPDDVVQLHDAIQDASNAGIIFCVSSGNESQDLDAVPSYPASYQNPNIISVAATGYSDNISYFSNYGVNSVHVAAPGELIASCWPGDDYQYLDGTSMACPFVTGIVALLKSREPGLTMQECRDRVMWTGDPLMDLQETTLTGLRVNADKALRGQYAVRILTRSPLDAGTVGQSYSQTLQAMAFRLPVTWSWSAPPLAERETANGFKSLGTAKGWHAEEGMWDLPLPFSFPFFGQAWNHVYVCSDGYLQFASTPPTADPASDVAGLASRRMIAVYWSDLTTDDLFGGDIYVYQAPDNSYMRIRWQCTESDWLFGGEINAEAVLYADGRIEMHYGPGNSSFVGGLVGVSAGDGATYRVSTRKSNQLDLSWAPTSVWAPGQLPPGLNLGSATGIIAGTPTQAGEFAFDITCQDSSGGEDTRPFEMKILTAAGPRAAFIVAPTSGIAPRAVQFTNQSTGGATTWAWNFGDGASSTLQSPQHTYSSPGRYTVALTATGAGGSDTATRVRYIEIYLGGPTADFEATPLVGDAPLTVLFTDLSQPSSPTDPDAEIILWNLDYGDGTSEPFIFEAPIDHPHTYSTPGVYTVTMQCWDWYEAMGEEIKFQYVSVLGPGITTTTTLPTHPADTDQNWRLVMNEMTAYGSAWLAGQTWGNPPADIPIEYLTAGGYLWKIGEVYHFDAARSAPQCWVAGP